MRNKRKNRVAHQQATNRWIMYYLAFRVSGAQHQKAARFHQQHHTGDLLVVPDIWDPLGALLAAELGFAAVGVSQVCRKYCQDPAGKKEQGAWLTLAQQIVACVSLPVTIDLPERYIGSRKQARELVRSLIRSGVVGVTLDDQSAAESVCFPVEQQCERIAWVREAAWDEGLDLFISARSTQGSSHLDRPQLRELVDRGAACLKAGANSFYPCGLEKEEDLAFVVNHLQRPVEALAGQDVPDLTVLRRAGIQRVNTGTWLLQLSVQMMRDALVFLQKGVVTRAMLRENISEAYLDRLANGAAQAPMAPVRLLHPK
jgi:2-methylisocitrate lyase-like PEP mutase family enzyme